MAKLKLTVTITPETIKWIDEQVKRGRFADRSHAVQFSLMKLGELLEGGRTRILNERDLETAQGQLCHFPSWERLLKRAT